MTMTIIIIIVIKLYCYIINNFFFYKENLAFGETSKLVVNEASPGSLIEEEEVSTSFNS